MGHFLPHALPQCLRFKHAVTLVTSASSFARNEYVRNVINNFVFVFLHPMGDFFPIEHASFALKGPQRFHTSDSVALPDYFSFHNIFDMFFHFVAVLTVSAMFGKNVWRRRRLASSLRFRTNHLHSSSSQFQ